MITKWTSHLTTQKEKDDFAKEVYSAKNVLDRLTQIVKEMDEEADQIETNPKFYELPNWDYRQANNNGYRRCLSILRKITNLGETTVSRNQGNN